ncbi:hypothetical protein QYM36_010760 [Artemia franciscana]|uniref:Reverse transcriptase domain-containing protein n=1 Tax=Artemia franciscana TaxID=6661 RepID=A0AA88HUW9_ARTSF|nr:hypothetical protein QYM36_010760 [Artemia franciscana]
MMQRLNKFLSRVIGAYQHGGIKGKKTQHILSVLKELVMRGDRELRRLILQMDLLAIMSIDVVKAYDSVVRAILWVLMERKYGMSRQVVKRFENIYKDPKIIVKVRGELTKEIEMEKALRQGDPLSPCPFETYMNPPFKYVESKIQGLPLTNGTNLKALAFMDDGNFVVGKLEDLKQVSLGL